jgi:para-aminobenzoate synthetase/4-amino-4-deoxychorismate lyase
MQQRSEVFALLDDCDSTAERRSSRLYVSFVLERSCHEAAKLADVCASVRQDLRDGLHAVVLADYEFGRNLQLAQPGSAALRFLLFRECTLLSREAADQWLAENDNGLTDRPSVAGVANIESSVTPDAFEHAIAGVQEALQAGDSYQINYTFRLAFNVFGSAVALYRRLRERQPVRYGALIAMPDGRDVLSCSPELFIEREGDVLRARPMKGTAPRSADPEWLRLDPKNRAENVMIVDLLRNDMSRVAVTGSVHVPKLFSVEAYKSVWQMTSTVEARLRPRTTFADILRALLPCGSITGAPKHKTMQLIDVLESTPRGIYTGAIGWLDEHDDFCLSVPIRTLEIERGRGKMGIGAGIVLDSVAADEFEECQLKARFLTGSDPGFQLFETTFATKQDGIRHWDRHLKRLASSAEWCGFPLDQMLLQRRISETCAGFGKDASYRLRIALAKSGEIDVNSAPLAPLAELTVNVLLASEYGFAPMSSGNPLLKHKTTSREEYDRAWREAEKQGAFDMLFCNERGELTEGGRSNVFLKLDGVWKTPPLNAGLLPGVMRGVLLKELEAEESTLTLDALNRAESLMICNALRGAVTARLKRKIERKR